MTKNKILPVFIPHGGCRHHCIFCDQYRITAGDHLPSAEELEALIPKDLDPDTELAFYGGSFTAIDVRLQTELLEAVKPFLESGQV